MQVEFNQQLYTIKNQQPEGFEIGYRDADSIIYVKALSKLDGRKVIVWNEDVKNPVSVRYGWLLPGEANLMNKEGLPAFPFEKTIY